MSFYNVRDQFGRFTKSAEGSRKRNNLVKRKKKNLLSRDYLVIDQSASMRKISNQTVSSINEYFDNLKKLSETVNIESNTILFDSFVSPIRNNDLKPWINGVDYRPDGMTALYDALATAINHAMSVFTEGQQVVITVITDGEENWSKQYPKSNIGKIKTLVERAKSQPYNFTINYIGAGDFLDIQASAQNIGIFASNIVNYFADNAGVKKVMSKMSLSRSAATVNYANTGENNNIGFFSND